MKDWYEIRNEAGAAEAEVLIYGYIGGGLFSDGASAAQVAEELAALDVRRLNVRINSPGGSAFDGAAIYNAVRRHPAETIVHIDGAALSAASLVAMAGDRIVMHEPSWMMIHEPYGTTEGTASDHRKTAEALDKLALSMAEVYAGRSHMDTAAAAEAMASETWYTAGEALASGLIDEIEAGGDVHAMAAVDLGVAYGYRHVPQALFSPAAAATPFADLPVHPDRQRPLRRSEAEPRIRAWASSDGSGDKDKIDWEKYRKAFFWYDDDESEKFESYKLIFADVVDGKLYAVARGVHGAAGVMQGARGGVDIPAADRAAVKAHIARYYAAMDETPPWEQEDAGEDLQAAGRVLSQANYDLLVQARDLIDVVLDASDSGSTASAGDSGSRLRDARAVTVVFDRLATR